MNDGLRTLASVTITAHDELYKLVDTLNRVLKDRNLLFGLSLEGDSKMTVTIYDTKD